MRLFRVSCEEVFTTETRSTEIGEFLDKELFTLRPQRLRGAISELCFTSKPEEREIKRLSALLRLLPVIAVFSCRPESGKVLLFFCS